MSDTIRDFCRYFDYPDEAEASLLSSEKMILACPDANAVFKAAENAFWQNYGENEESYVDSLNEAAELSGVHRYAVYLLFFILQAPKMEQEYRIAGIPAQICRDSLLDLKWKMQKTHQIWGIWGTFCSDWFGGFFRLKRFALGRLEFEITESVCTYSDHAHTVCAGAPVISVHIPASGPLIHNAALDSYRQAEAFFRNRFPKGPIPFCCETWMLYPGIAHILPPGNIRRFTADYTVVDGHIDPEQDDRWRVFRLPNEAPIQSYPEDTGLQRSLKAWLLQGNRMGIGIGYFFFENGQFVKQNH